MLSYFNIQYKTSRSDNILVLAQCKCVKIRLANVREVIWFSNNQVTHMLTSTKTIRKYPFHNNLTVIERTSKKYSH